MHIDILSDHLVEETETFRVALSYTSSEAPLNISRPYIQVHIQNTSSGKPVDHRPSIKSIQRYFFCETISNLCIECGLSSVCCNGDRVQLCGRRYSPEQRQ